MLNRTLDVACPRLQEQRQDDTWPPANAELAKTMFSFEFGIRSLDAGSRSIARLKTTIGLGLPTLLEIPFPQIDCGVIGISGTSCGERPWRSNGKLTGGDDRIWHETYPCWPC
jgi:hypothetical protein